ncbi:hypothetical protein HDU98_004423 [Podochytrium sp. JEL0797]|nr:hypothetical protein HDU98_004423 [Podochytrium sp. JEL0797]
MVPVNGNCSVVSVLHPSSLPYRHDPNKLPQSVTVEWVHQINSWTPSPSTLSSSAASRNTLSLTDGARFYGKLMDFKEESVISQVFKQHKKARMEVEEDAKPAAVRGGVGLEGVLEDAVDLMHVGGQYYKTAENPNGIDVPEFFNSFSPNAKLGDQKQQDPFNVLLRENDDGFDMLEAAAPELHLKSPLQRIASLEVKDGPSWGPILMLALLFGIGIKVIDAVTVADALNGGDAVVWCTGNEFECVMADRSEEGLRKLGKNLVIEFLGQVVMLSHIEEWLKPANGAAPVAEESGFLSQTELALPLPPPAMRTFQGESVWFNYDLKNGGTTAAASLLQGRDIFGTDKGSRVTEQGQTLDGVSSLALHKKLARSLERRLAKHQQATVEDMDVDMEEGGRGWQRMRELVEVETQLASLNEMIGAEQIVVGTAATDMDIASQKFEKCFSLLRNDMVDARGVTFASEMAQIQDKMNHLSDRNVLQLGDFNSRHELYITSDLRSENTNKRKSGKARFPGEVYLSMTMSK